MNQTAVTDHQTIKHLLIRITKLVLMVLKDIKDNERGSALA